MRREWQGAVSAAGKDGRKHAVYQYESNAEAWRYGGWAASSHGAAGDGVGYALWTHPMWLAALAGILVPLLAVVGVGNGACLLMAKRVKKM